MAKNVTELGNDVIDDTVVEGKKSRLSKKQRNYAIGLPILFVLLVGIGVLYYFAVTNWLLDYENMTYITYLYVPSKENPGEITASINRVLPESNYPADFRIPAQINGYKITRIEDNAFAGCTRLKKIRMTNNIEYIGEEAFAGCEKLAQVSLSNNINYIGSDAFLETAYQKSWGADDLIYCNEVLIHIGANLLGDKSVIVTDVASHTDRINQYLNAGYTVFDMDTLSRIDSIDNISNKKINITQWMDGLFANNKSIEIAEIPVNLNAVPTKGFIGCEKLERVILNDNIVEIGDFAFTDCSELQYVTLPESVKKIGEAGFKGTKVSFDTLPQNITTLSSSVFQNCENITSFTLPKSISAIPDYAFSNNTNLSTFAFEDKDKVRSIGIGAFEKTALTTFEIPKKVLIIADRTFAECPNLTGISVYENLDGSFEEVIVDYDAEGKPIMGKRYFGINRIDGFAFQDSPKFKSIKLFDKDYKALPECTDDGTLYMPLTLQRTNATTTTSDGGYTFANTSVEHVIFPKELTTIGQNLFDGVTTLKTVTFKDIADSKLINIGNAAFINCTGITEMELPNTVSFIGTSAFEGCTNLKTINIPDYNLLTEAQKEGAKKLTTLKNNIFKNCSSLTSIVIPDTITYLSDGVFEGCTSLTQLIIPESVKTIEKDSFKGCTNLTLYAKATEKPRKWARGYDKDLVHVYFGNEWSLIDGEIVVK